MKKSLLTAALLYLKSLSTTVSRTDAVDPCAAAAEALKKNYETIKPQRPSIPGQTAFECLSTLPINETLSLSAVEQLRRYLPFYSAQTYWLTPPTPELQVPPVYPNETLNSVEEGIKNGTYKTDYAVNRVLQGLFAAYKDGHTGYNPTCYNGMFLYTHDYPLMSFGSSSTSLPSIYLANWISDTTVVPGHEVTHINGQNASDYLINFADTSPEMDWSDPDARYNQLFVNLASGSLTNGTFSNRAVYPEDPMKLTLANGDDITVEWKAIFVSPLNEAGTDVDTVVPFNDTQSLFQKLCIRSPEELSITPTSLAPSFKKRSLPSTPQPSLHKYSLPAKLKRDTSNNSIDFFPEFNSSLEPGHEVGFYKLSSQTGVLSINSFLSSINATAPGFERNFSRYINETLHQAHSENLSHLIIDLTGNGGGDVAVGQDTARQFFPNSENNFFFGENERWNPLLADALLHGNQTSFADYGFTYYDLNETLTSSDNNFTSYEEWLGPVHRDNDYFTQISVVNEKQLDTDDGGELSLRYIGPQLFNTSNIIIVTNSLCASTCAVFAQALTSQGVRSVALGGRPRIGPMQTIGGTKGSQVLEFDDIAGFQAAAYDFNETRIQEAPGHVDPFPIRLSSGRVNVRNSWRKDDGQHLPIELLYEPSTWKLFYTEEMWRDLTKVWAAVAEVAWGNGRDASGGNYVPVNGINGEKWDSGVRDANGNNITTAGGDGKTGKGQTKLEYKNLGQLIWTKMHGGKLD